MSTTNTRRQFEQIRLGENANWGHLRERLQHCLYNYSTRSAACFQRHFKLINPRCRFTGVATRVARHRGTAVDKTTTRFGNVHFSAITAQGWTPMTLRGSDYPKSLTKINIFHELVIVDRSVGSAWLEGVCRLYNAEHGGIVVIPAVNGESAHAQLRQLNKDGRCAAVRFP